MRLFLCLNYRQVMRLIMMIYFHLQRDCNVTNFRHKKSASSKRKRLICIYFVVGRARFERATIALKVRCSTG